MQTVQGSVYVNSDAIKDAAQDVAQAWSKAFDPDDPPCPPVEVIARGIVRWLERSCEDLLEDADWYIRNSNHADGRRMVKAVLEEIKQAEQEGALSHAGYAKNAREVIEDAQAAGYALGYDADFLFKLGRDQALYVAKGAMRKQEY